MTGTAPCLPIQSDTILVDDMMSLVTSFSGKLYGLRSKGNRRNTMLNNGHLKNLNNAEED